MEKTTRFNLAYLAIALVGVMLLHDLWSNWRDVAFLPYSHFADPVHKVSIIPRGVGALGYTMQRPTEDRFLMTREELESKLTVLLGGRAAEDLVFGQLSTGAADDLARATDIARSMVTRYAMVPELGHATYDEDPGSLLGRPAPGLGGRLYGEATAREIDCAVRTLVDAAFVRARHLLGANRVLLEKAAGELLARETLGESELRELLAGLVRPSPAHERAGTAAGG
jgi:cell division protease FtsH